MSSKSMLNIIQQCVMFLSLATSINACRNAQEASMLLDGISVADTSKLLVDIEASRVPLTITVSLNDLREFEDVRMVADEAVKRGHEIALRGDDMIKWDLVLAEGYGEELIGKWRAEYESLTKRSLRFIFLPIIMAPNQPANVKEGLKQALISQGVTPLFYNLDAAPEYVMDPTKLIKDTLKAANGKIGVIAYFNSFIGSAALAQKIMATATGLRASNLQLVPMTQCYSQPQPEQN